MKLKEYLSSKAITFCFLLIGMITFSAFLICADFSVFAVFAMDLFFLFLVFVWATVTFFAERAQILDLEQKKSQIQQEYLLGELLPKPSGFLEQKYFEIMKTVSRSAIGTIEEAIREKEEYCDYVESWIHEIKTPLTACSLILSNDKDERKLRRELKRAENLTETILYYARMRTPQKDVHIQKISVASVLDEAVKSQKELLIAAKISVKLEGNFTVFSDRKALCFMIKQLLINCAKYCKGCHILLTAKNPVIEVLDDGIGIPSHEIRRVTDRGFTGSNGRKFPNSTGMGLYLVKELCSYLHMELSIDSKIHSYTCIRLAFKM